MSDGCRPRHAEQLDRLGRRHPTGAVEVLNEPLGATGQRGQDPGRDRVGQECHPDRRGGLDVHRLGESGPTHPLVHPVDALAELAAVAEVSDRAGDARVPREPRVADVVHPHESRQAARDFDLQPVIEQLDPDVVATSASTRSSSRLADVASG
jgi:hypothetical protein